jgi:hypothetical protein
MERGVRWVDITPNWFIGAVISPGVSASEASRVRSITTIGNPKM